MEFKMGNILMQIIMVNMENLFQNQKKNLLQSIVCNRKTKNQNDHDSEDSIRI